MAAVIQLVICVYSGKTLDCKSRIAFLGGEQIPTEQAARMARVGEHGTDLPVWRICPADNSATLSSAQYRRGRVHQEKHSLSG